MKKVLLVLILTASVSYAAPVSLISESTYLAGQTRTATGNTYSHVIDGQTAYVEFMKGGVTKIQNINGVQTSSVLFTQTDWAAASGGSASLTAFYGFGMSGNNLIWTDTASDAVWTANTTTGAITNIVSKTAIGSFVGGTAATNGAFTVAPNGGLTFMETGTKTMLNVDLSGNLTTVLPAGFTENSIISGLTYDSAGRVYWGDNTADTIYRKATDGSIEAVISSSEVYALTNQTNASFNDIFAGPNGWMYFYEAADNSILQFNISNPEATLSILVETSGRANTFGLYSNGGVDYLTYHAYTGDIMGVVVPEPTTIGLLSLGGLLLRRFKK
ncbi:MAG: hypothetical protein A2Y12_04510 [Planctomycetes bacterium GWF2_42_9]|nr:MAG: hypothetical protein A2Y12_04510 [Planctomycetes bacterium GWF2_42_9]HAL45209.1 hypothetical protein [Phycisphaerales bacterium]